MDGLFKVEILKYRKSITFKTFQGHNLRSRHMAVFHFINRRVTTIYFNEKKTKSCDEMVDFWVYSVVLDFFCPFIFWQALSESEKEKNF